MSIEVLSTFDGLDDPKQFQWFMGHRKCSWCQTITGRWCESCLDTWRCEFTGSNGRPLCSIHDQLANINMCRPCFVAKVGITMYELEVCLANGPGPWKLLAMTPEFFQAPTIEPKMEDGTQPIDGVSYCSRDVFDQAMCDGTFDVDVN